MTKRCLLVLGPPRSGTSYVTHLLGEHFDGLPSNMFAPDAINPDGYWEAVPIVDIHEQILAECRSDWQSPKQWTIEDLSQTRLEHYTGRLWYEYSRCYPDRGIPVLKDPRVSRLAPLWLKIFQDQQVWVGCVIVYRPYHQVIKSLAAAWGTSETVSLQIWSCYMLDAEHNSRAIPRVFISFEQAMLDQKQALEAVFRSLGEALRDSVQAPAEIDTILKPELVHHRHANTGQIESSEWLDFADAIDTHVRAAIDTGIVDTHEFDTLRAGFYKRVAEE